MRFKLVLTWPVSLFVYVDFFTMLFSSAGFQISSNLLSGLFVFIDVFIKFLFFPNRVNKLHIKSNIFSNFFFYHLSSFFQLLTS